MYVGRCDLQIVGVVFIVCQKSEECMFGGIIVSIKMCVRVLYIIRVCVYCVFSAVHRCTIVCVCVLHAVHACMLSSQLFVFVVVHILCAAHVLGN